MHRSGPLALTFEGPEQIFGGVGKNLVEDSIYALSRKK